MGRSDCALVAYVFMVHVLPAPQEVCAVYVVVRAILLVGVVPVAFHSPSASALDHFG